MMSRPLLQRLFAHRRWADHAFLDSLEALDPDRHAQVRDSSLRLLQHMHLVDRIFAAHLVGAAHGIDSTDPASIPTLDGLRESIGTCLDWYQRYVESVPELALTEAVSFVFTDGDAGCMSREEMLLHVLTHGGYHRGEIGRLLASTGAALPWDTFAVFLHAEEPGRRTLRNSAPAH